MAEWDFPGKLRLHTIERKHLPNVIVLFCDFANLNFYFVNTRSWKPSSRHNVSPAEADGEATGLGNDASAEMR